MIVSLGRRLLGLIQFSADESKMTTSLAMLCKTELLPAVSPHSIPSIKTCIVLHMMQYLLSAWGAGPLHPLPPVNYLLRVTTVQCTKSGAQVFDELVEKSLRHIVGGVLDTEIFRELQLPAEVKLNCQSPTLGLGLLLPPPRPPPHSYLLRHPATP